MTEVGTERRSPRPLAYGEWMTVATAEYGRILRLLPELADGSWDRATDCAGWTVHDVVAHLAGAAASTASPRELIRQAWLGRRSGRAGDLVDRMNQIQVAERRGLTPAALRGDLAATSRRGLATRRRVPAPLRAVRLPFGPPLGTRPLGYLLGRIYTRDAWMHRVDLSCATGATLELTADHDGAVVADLVAEWAAAHGRPYELHLTGPAGGRWRAGEPDTVLELDAVEFARTLSGRAPGTGLLTHRVPF
ncbi:MAG TPA: maleylpyruvate isomerase family mycothiol-dependent enzyme [Mycobacteriales bacterium]|nr:maleylpyruvate isomerase family mycothiol-dependent enzyme [Mycobacteriales bacterium]